MLLTELIPKMKAQNKYPHDKLDSMLQAAVDCTRKVVAAVEKHLNVVYSFGSKYRVSELFGVDIVFTKDFKPMVMEFNRRPDISKRTEHNAVMWNKVLTQVGLVHLCTAGAVWGDACLVPCRPNEFCNIAGPEFLAKSDPIPSHRRYSAKVADDWWKD